MPQRVSVSPRIYNSRNYNGVLNETKNAYRLQIYNSRNYNGVLNLNPGE